MSLRARLILGLLVLAAAGLVTLAAITYAEQRSFQLNRVDQEARTSIDFIDRELDCHGANVPGFAPPTFGCEDVLLGVPGAPGSPVTAPPGTFGERRDGSGTPLKPVVWIYRRLLAPKLPANIAPNQPISVNSDSGTGFRVLAEPTHDQPGETIIAIPLTDVAATLHRLFVIEALVVGSVLAALAVLAWWLVRLGLRPLDRIAATAGAIAKGDLSQRVTPANERTEVGRLGLALNAMLVQIEKAFRKQEESEDRLRRFLADASHELRTPLQSIRGYAELYRLGASEDPQRAASSMARIESEAARMGQLVENLLMLARLDQVPEVARKRVELGELVGEAVEDARAAAPERRVELQTRGAVAVLGDRSQLKQVVSNLLRNALVHTPRGTEVEVRVGADGAEAIVDVRDHGKGLPTGDSEALFERFWRAEPGRGRGVAGAGLGLSIVKAIVEAHGGRVNAANAPGGGALFRVRLPLSEQARQPRTSPVAGGKTTSERQ
jgi:two-component system OmpR family sensor kinase